MEATAEKFWDKADVIHTYTRREAIEDGVLVDLSELYPNDTRIYKYPVACTARVWEAIKKVCRTYEECGAYVWDLCYMSVKYRVRVVDESTVLFQIGVPLGARRPTTLKCVCGPGDNAEPVITIMYPDED